MTAHFTFLYNLITKVHRNFFNPSAFCFFTVAIKCMVFFRFVYVPEQFYYEMSLRTHFNYYTGITDHFAFFQQ